MADTASSTAPVAARPFAVASRFEAASSGIYAGELSEDWYQGRAVYGGLVAGIMANAMGAEAGDGRSLRTLHATFCAPATAGPAEVRTEIVRKGRSIAFVRARLERDGTPLAIATGTFARRRTSTLAIEAARRPLRAVEEVEDGPEVLYIPAFCRHLEFRQASGPAAFSGGDEAAVAGWCRLREGPLVPHPALAMALLDAWAPAALSCHPRWVPCASIDLFVQVHADLTDEGPVDWLAYEARSQQADGGYADERSTLAFPDGRPIASARQLVAIFD